MTKCGLNASSVLVFTFLNINLWPKKSEHSLALGYTKKCPQAGSQRVKCISFFSVNLRFELFRHMIA